MPMLDRDGVGIWYEVHCEGPAILLSHGYSATCRMWDGQIAGATKVVIADAGHASNLHQPAAFNLAMEGFLAVLT